MIGLGRQALLMTAAALSFAGCGSGSSPVDAGAAGQDMAEMAPDMTAVPAPDMITIGADMTAPPPDMTVAVDDMAAVEGDMPVADDMAGSGLDAGVDSGQQLPVTIEVIVAPTTTCTAGEFHANVVGATGTPTFAWDFHDGTTGSGATVSHRFLTPGSHSLSVTVIDDAGQGSANANVSIVAVSRDVRLRFAVRAATPDFLNYIRNVTLDARAIGVPAPIRMYDDGFSGEDATGGDGVYTCIIYVASCENLSQQVHVEVQDATGRTNTIPVAP